MRVRPTARAVMVAAGGMILAVLPSILDARLWMLWVGFVALLVLLLGIDGLAAPRGDQVEARVELPNALFIGDEGVASIHLNGARLVRPVAGQALLETGDNLEVPLPIDFLLSPGAETVLPLPLRPHRRGRAEVRAIWLRFRGPLGLVHSTLRRSLHGTVPVVPNVRAVRAAALRLFRAREFVQGLKTERFLGDGSEFDSLREYMPGFDHRAMDWKASARHVKLIAREYRSERNHQMVIAFDTGHLMCEPLGGAPRLDHGINAGLLLSYAALKTGDRVGLFAFDERPQLFTEPRGGLAAFPRIQRVTSEIEYSSGETNFTLGLMTLSSRLKRRSLIVIFTDFVDTVTVELMVENMDRLARRHLILSVTLTDPELTGMAGRRPRDIGELNRAVVAGDLLREREVVLKRLRRLGVHCLDVPSHAVSARVINRYLEIKRRELV